MIAVLLGTFAAYGQRPAPTIVYDSLGRPLRQNHELIVEFAPAVINQLAVSSYNGSEGSLNTFLKPAAAAAIQSGLGLDLSSIYAIKLMARAVPADSVSIDQTGQVVPVHPWWSILLVILPPGTDDYAAQNALRQQPFTIIKSVGMNWATVLSSGTTSNGPCPFLQASGTPTLLTYPQPAQRTLTFALPSPLPATADLTILTSSGQVLRTEKHRIYTRGELTPLQIDLATLPAGQYFYRLTTPHTTYHGRFEKQ